MGNVCASKSPSAGQADIRREYKLGRVLGSGSFGQVRECRRKTIGSSKGGASGGCAGGVYAVKIMDRRMRSSERRAPGRPSNEQMMRSEMQILQTLDHPNIVGFVAFFEDRRRLYCVMEKCEGGELFHQIVSRRQFTEADAAALCKQMLSALAYLHARGVVHRDVKAENFLFKDTTPNSPIKLIDFGMSARLPPCGYLTDLCGSPHYISPELINKKYDTGADMWAFGVMLYLMLFGRYPFEGGKASVIAREVQTKQLDWSRSACSFLTEAAVDFVSKLLSRNQANRLSAQQALEHPWISQATEDKALSIIGKEKLELARRLSSDNERYPTDASDCSRRNSRYECMHRCTRLSSPHGAVKRGAHPSRLLHF